ncbi:unnamed protein product [Amoebophrya sp. A120]|nr:unnamed protein product [Amoebophrya sp. A120]|eukprot:GSA120T00000990001.1
MAACSLLLLFVASCSVLLRITEAKARLLNFALQQPVSASCKKMRQPLVPHLPTTLLMKQLRASTSSRTGGAAISCLRATTLNRCDSDTLAVRTTSTHFPRQEEIWNRPGRLSVPRGSNIVLSMPQQASVCSSSSRTFFGTCNYPRACCSVVVSSSNRTKTAERSILLNGVCHHRPPPITTSGVLGRVGVRSGRSFASIPTKEHPLVFHRSIPSKTPADPPDDVEKVFILPGLLGSTDNWVPATKKLAAKVPGKDFILIDARNHGKSFHAPDSSFEAMVADLKRLVDSHTSSTGSTTPRSRVSIIGHSLGGKTSMRFALKHANLVRKLIVVDIAPRRYNVDYYVLLLSHLQAAAGTTHLSSRKAAEAWLQKGLDENRAGRYFEEFYRQHGMQAVNTLEKTTSSSASARQAMVEKVLNDLSTDKNLRAFLLKNLATAEDKSKLEWRPNLPALLANWPGLAGGFFDEGGDIVDAVNISALDKTAMPPCLVLRGGAGGYVEVDRDLPEFQKMFPETAIDTIDGAGHWPHASHTDIVVEKIAEFLLN